MLSDALVRELFQAFLVFARLGTALMLVPGFGEQYVLARQRLLLGLLLSALLVPTLAPRLPAPPAEPGRLLVLVGGEVLVGLVLGAVTRTALAVTHVAGSLVAMQSGLQAAAFFDPNEATQGTLPGNLFATTALVVMFAGDLHHMLLKALAASYARLPVAAGVPAGDALQLMTALVGRVMLTGFEIAAPLTLTSLLANLALGILGRMVPALQLFTLALPVQLLLATALLLLGVAAAAAGFGQSLDQGLALIAGGG